MIHKVEIPVISDSIWLWIQNPEIDPDVYPMLLNGTNTCVQVVGKAKIIKKD